MSPQLLLNSATVLSVIALAVSALGACGAFKSRRQRELDARLKQSLYGAHGREPAASAASATPAPAAKTKGAVHGHLR